MAEKKVSILISAKNATAAAFASVQKGLSGMADKAKALFSPGGLVGGALAGGGLALVGKSFLDTASNFEALETSLTTVTGSLQGAKDAMAFVNQEAKASPFTVMKMAEAFKTLLAYGINAKEVMRTLVDTSASMGKPLDMAVQALSDAMQGEGERLKEFGIKQRVNGDQLVYTWVDAMGRVRETIAQNNPKIIQETLQGIWNEKYAGGAQRFQSTWQGLTSTLKSYWDEFVNSMMNFGPFQTLKGFVSGLIAEIEKLKSSGAFSEIAKDFGQNITGGILKVINFLPELARLIIKGVEYLMLALSGWKQLIAGGGALFTQIQIWSIDFINGLRGVMMSLAQIAGKIPGVDTSDTQRGLMMDSYNSELRKEQLGNVLEEQLTELGKVQIAQDEMVAKWDRMADGAKAMMQGVIEPAAAAAAAAANVGESAATGMAKANQEADAYIEKLKQIQALNASGSFSPSGQFKGQTSFNESDLDRLSRTEG